MINIIRNKYLPTFAFWPYPFLPLPKMTCHDQDSKFINLFIYQYIFIYKYYNKISTDYSFRAYQRIFGRASLVGIEPNTRLAAHAQISPPSFCFSLLSLLSLPWPSSDRRETRKEKKRNEFIKKYSLS